MDLLRRSAFSMGGGEFVTETLGSLRDMGAGTDAADISIDPPCVQVLPLAVYL